MGLVPIYASLGRAYFNNGATQVQPRGFRTSPRTRAPFAPAAQLGELQRGPFLSGVVGSPFVTQASDFF